MKTYKKLFIGVGLLLASSVLFGFVPQQVLAASTGTANDIKACTNGTLLLVDAAHITCKNASGGTITFVDSNPNDGIENYIPTDSGLFCDPGDLPATTHDVGRFGINLAGSSSGKVVPADLIDPGILTSHTVRAFVNLGFGDCTRYVIPGGSGNEVTIAVSGSFVPPTTTTGPGDGGGSGTTAPSCETNFSNAFSWVMCPSMDLADAAAGQFNDFVSDQLCFSTGTTSSTGGVVCGSNNNLTDGVHKAWNIFKNIASALLVVVLLIAVISQAIGGGPFDAYTIRKMLPKIVTAVIVMQLSWVLLRWLIDLSNDVGSGINALMLAPFGGADHITLSHLTGGYDLSGQNTAVQAGVATFAFFGALAALAIVSVPGLLLMALYVVLALLTAFVVLLLRKMLIIFLVILAPIAFVLWILPGTEKYWKMWSDNFTKLLLMFPMIMGLIAAGKIFATIASGTNASIFNPHLAIAHLGALPVPYLASFSDFVGLVIILGAWFMPYFLLPQTFKWGGAAMGATSRGVANMTEKAGKPANEYLKWRQGLSPWKQARATRRSEQERRAKLGFAQGLTSRGVGGAIRRGRLRGVPPPTVAGVRRERDLRGRIVQSAQAEVDKNRKEDIERSTIELMQWLNANFTASQQDLVREAIANRTTMRVTRLDGTTENFDGARYADTHAHGQRAALDRALIHGQNSVVDQYYTEAVNSGDATRYREATEFKDENAAALGEKLPHILKGFDVAVTNNEGAIAKMSGHEVESILAHYTTRVADLQTRAAAATAAGDHVLAADLTRQANHNQALFDGFVQRHHQARANPNLSGSVDLDGSAAVDAYTEIVTAPIPPGTPSVATVATMTPANRAAALATLPPPLRGAYERIIDINTGVISREAGRGDRENNRSRYRTPAGPPAPTPGRPGEFLTTTDIVV